MGVLEKYDERVDCPWDADVFFMIGSCEACTRRSRGALLCGQLRRLTQAVPVTHPKTRPVSRDSQSDSQNLNHKIPKLPVATTASTSKMFSIRCKTNGLRYRQVGYHVNRRYATAVDGTQVTATNREQAEMQVKKCKLTFSSRRRNNSEKILENCRYRGEAR